MVLWRTTWTYPDFPWRSSRLIKRKLHHRLWRLPYTEVLVCHKQRVEVFHLNLSIERSWVPFRCWVSLFLTRFTSIGSTLLSQMPSEPIILYLTKQISYKWKIIDPVLKHKLESLIITIIITILSKSKYFNNKILTNISNFT